MRSPRGAARGGRVWLVPGRQIPATGTAQVHVERLLPGLGGERRADGLNQLFDTGDRHVKAGWSSHNLEVHMATTLGQHTDAIGELPRH